MKKQKQNILRDMKNDIQVNSALAYRCREPSTVVSMSLLQLGHFK